MVELICLCEQIAGIIPLGTSMDYESERTRKLGCWVRFSAPYIDVVY